MPTAAGANGVVVVIVTGWFGGSKISRMNALLNVNGGVLLSVTRIVKLKVPTFVVVPLMVVPDRDKPGGSVPEKRENVYGPVPPDALSV